MESDNYYSSPSWCVHLEPTLNPVIPFLVIYIADSLVYNVK